MEISTVPDLILWLYRHIKIHMPDYPHAHVNTFIGIYI